MKRFQVTVAVAILAVAGMSSTASAQQPGGRRGFGGIGGGASLLMNQAVQKELNITDEQKEKLQTALRGGGRGDLQNLSREERRKKL